MRHQREFVRGVELHEAAASPSRGKKCAESSIRENPLNEILAQMRIAQAPFLLDRQIRKTSNQRRREQSGAVARGHPRRSVHAHALHTATRRIFFQQVARKICGCEIRDTFRSVRVHRRGVIDGGFVTDEPYLVATVETPEGVRFNTTIVCRDPTELTIGMPLEVVFEPVSPDVVVPKFRPAS